MVKQSLIPELISALKLKESKFLVKFNSEFLEKISFDILGNIFYSADNFYEKIINISNEYNENGNMLKAFMNIDQINTDIKKHFNFLKQENYRWLESEHFLDSLWFKYRVLCLIEAVKQILLEKLNEIHRLILNPDIFNV